MTVSGTPDATMAQHNEQQYSTYFSDEEQEVYSDPYPPEAVPMPGVFMFPVAQQQQQQQQQQVVTNVEQHLNVAPVAAKQLAEG